MPFFRRKPRVELATLVEAVAYYRALGFFASSTLDDAALAAHLEATRSDEDRDGRLEPGERNFDAFLMLRDRNRMIHVGMEGDFFREGDGYRDLLRDLARISRGRIALGEVREEWTDEEHLRLHFALAGTIHVYEPDVLHDWLDPSFVPDVDELAGGQARIRFLEDDGSFFMVDLTDEEAERLRHDLL